MSRLVIIGAKFIPFYTRFYILLAESKNIAPISSPDKRIIKTFGVIDKAPLEVGTSAILCMAEQFGAFDRDNLIVPIWMI